MTALVQTKKVVATIIINIEEHIPHKVSEVICLNCLKRWVSVRPEETRLNQLECPNCKNTGFTIETGEIYNF